MARGRDVKLKLEDFFCTLNQYFSTDIFLPKHRFVFVQSEALQQAADLCEYWLQLGAEQKNPSVLMCILAYLLNG